MVHGSGFGPCRQGTFEGPRILLTKQVCKLKRKTYLNEFHRTVLPVKMTQLLCYIFGIITKLLGAWKRNFPALAGNFDRQTNEPTNGRT